MGPPKNHPQNGPMHLGKHYPLLILLSRDSQQSRHREDKPGSQII